MEDPKVFFNNLFIMEQQEQQTKYFTENKYKEIAKSLNEFEKDASPTGENINVGSRNQPETSMINEAYSHCEGKQTSSYGPVYYLNQIVDTHQVPGQTLSKLKEFQNPLKTGEQVFQNVYEGLIPDKADISPKEELIKAKLTQLESKRKFETKISTDLLDCVNSPETSPNLIPCSHENYVSTSDNEDGKDTTKSSNSSLVEMGQSDMRGGNGNGHSHPKAIRCEYLPIHYNSPQSDSMVSSHGYYVPISYSQQIPPKRNTDERDEEYMDYNTRKDTAYFNTVKLTYDENTKSYHPTIQLLEDGNNNFVYRPTMLRTDELTSAKVIPLFKYISENHNFTIDNPESYFSTSIKRDIMEDGRVVDMRNQRVGMEQLIAEREPKEKKPTRKGTGAGRPKLNRNHYSCSLCQTKNTPQWRYHNGAAVCNACYMRMRKDRAFPYGSNRGKGKRS